MTTINPTITPFSFDVLCTLAMGDPRASGMAYGPWEISFTEDVICLDGAPVTLHSWDQALELVAERLDAFRWLESLRADVERRAAITG